MKAFINYNFHLLRNYFERDSPFIKVYLAFLPFFFILIFGTVGYMVVSDYSFFDALYMTAITVSTIGYGEVQPLTTEGRIFTIILILINLTLFTFFVSYTTRYFLDGHFQKNYKYWRMKHSIEQLKDHIILCGIGRNGSAALEMLTLNNTPVVVIEKHQAKIDSSEIPVRYFFVNDATKEDVLLDAGIKNAKALIITLPDDAENVFIVLTARELNPNLKIIARASNDSSISKMKTAGAHNVIMPDKVGGIHMAKLILNPDINEFLDYMISKTSDNFHITEIENTAPRKMRDLNATPDCGVTVLGIKISSGHYILNPQPDQSLNAGDRLIVMGNDTQISCLKKKL
jgi:voltage-gated potassium channel